MNPQLQSRTDPMLVHAYPACAIADFERPKPHLPAHATITPKHVRCNEPALPTRSPHANSRLAALQNQHTRIQRP
jgi:hypothetical protein